MNQKEGFEVTEIITSGEKAIEIVAKKQPDIILMAIFLAGTMNAIRETKISTNTEIEDIEQYVTLSTSGSRMMIWSSSWMWIAYIQPRRLID